MKSNDISLLAIDGGGTKTLAVTVDKNGTVVGEGKAGATNYHGVGREAVIRELNKAIKSAISDISMSNDEIILVERAVFAISGIDTASDERVVREMVEAAISLLPVQINELLIENDCLSAMLGATSHQPGLLLISGTGSIAYAHDGNHNIVRVGGWGHRVGDEGSGYWIGKEAIRAVLKMLDGREERGVLADLVLQHFNFETADDLFNWVNSSDYSVNKVGTLAVIVDEAFQQGDLASKHILDGASEELFSLLLTAVKNSKLTSLSCKIVLQGGILLHNSYIRENLLSRIQREIPQAKVMTANEEPIHYIIKRGLTEYPS